MMPIRYEDPQGWQEHLWYFLRYPPTWIIQIGVILFLALFFLLLLQVLQEWIPPTPFNYSEREWFSGDIPHPTWPPWE